MSYLVFCTFDLKNASTQDYSNAYSDLRNIGLARVVKSDDGGEVVIPTTSVMGQVGGASAVAVCTNVRDRITAAFKARGFRSEVFVTAGADWAWAAETT